jgi:hypothetical protein
MSVADGIGTEDDKSTQVGVRRPLRSIKTLPAEGSPCTMPKIVKFVQGLQRGF